mgnify:FL=1
MPIGVMINALSVVVGGLVGAVAGGLLKDDFKACGGFIMLATGFRMIKVKMFPIADMVPAMILVMPISALWVNHIMPLVS